MSANRWPAYCFALHYENTSITSHARHPQRSLISFSLGRSITPMLRIIKSPTRIQAAGNPPKAIEEFIGPVTSETTALSVARMVSPPVGASRVRPRSLTSSPSFYVVSCELRHGMVFRMFWPARLSSHHEDSGCVIARPVQRVQSMSQYVHQHFHHRQFTETHTEAA